MDLEKLVYVVFLVSVLCGTVSAGSTFNYNVDTTSEWESGFNVGNTTVENGELTTPQEFIKFGSYGSYKEVDGFEHNDLSGKYSGDTGSFSISSSDPLSGSYHLESSSSTNVISSSSVASISQGDSFRSSVKFPGTGQTDNAGLIFGYQDSGNYYLVNPVDYDDSGSTADELQIYIKSGGSFTKLSGKSASASTFSNTDYYTIKVDWGSNGDITAIMEDQSGNQVLKTSANDNSYTSGDIGFRNAGGTIRFDSSGSGSGNSISWSGSQSSSGWNIYSSNITQSKSSGWATRDFKSSSEVDDYIGGIFSNDLVGEQSHYTYDGGETDMVGSGLLYDAPAEGITDGWSYISTSADTGTSTTITCNGNEHTIEWGKEDSTTAYIMINGVKETINEGNLFRYGDHSGYPDSDCGETFDDQEINPYLITSSDVNWESGATEDDIAHTEGDNFNMQTEPIDEPIFTPDGIFNTVNISVGIADPDVITQVQLDSIYRDETGVAVDGDGANDDDIFVYSVNSGSATQQCEFPGAIAPDTEHTLASVKGDLAFGDESYDLISINDDNKFEFLDPAGSGGDNCNDKILGNPTSGTLTGVASNQRDVDQDGNAELVFTVANSGGDHNANGWIYHADFGLDSLSDVTNTSIRTHEGDVGLPSDWDADNEPEITYRDPNQNVKIANFDNSLSDTGLYKSANDSRSKPFEASNLTVNYQNYDSTIASLEFSWLERGFNTFLGGTSSTYSNDQFAEDVMYDSVTMRFNYSGGSGLSNPLGVNDWTLWGNRFERTAEWNSSTIQPDDPTPNSMGSYVKPTSISADVYDPNTSNVVDNHKVNLKVSSRDVETGFWNGYFSNVDNVPLGDALSVKAQIVNEDDFGDPKLGNTSRVRSIDLDYVFPNVPVEVNSFNESKDVDYVQAGENLVVESRIYDSDGTSDIVEPHVEITYPDSSTQTLTNGNLISTSDGFLYEFDSSYNPDSSSDLGSGSIDVVAQDGNSVKNTSNSFEVKDTRSPVYQNLVQGSDEVEQGQNNTLSVDVKDEVTVDKVHFWTDEGSGYSKYATRDVSVGDSFQQVQKDYDTTSLNDGDAVSWKAEIVDQSGNSKNTSVKSFNIIGLKLIDNLRIDYRKVGSGNVEKRFYIDLDENENLDTYENVPGADTIEFTSEKWTLENFTIPFDGNFSVNNTDGVETVQEIDFNISVKDVRGHPLNANPTYQEKNKTIVVDNSKDSFDVNVSCTNNNYGSPVSGSVDTVFSVLQGSKTSHACRWSGDWITEDYRDADPTVSQIEIDDLLDVERNVFLENNESVDFPSINLTGFAEPDPTCSIYNNSEFGVNADSNRTEPVSFDCDIGDSGNPQLTLNSVDDYTEYSFATTLNVSSDLAENISISWEFNKSELQDWSSKDTGSAVAYVKGTKDDILLAESSNTVEVIVPDDAFSSSLHEGEHQASVEYTKGDDGGSSNGGGAGSSGGSGESAVEVTENITGEYNWTFSAPRSPGEKFFNILGWSRRDLSRTPVFLEVRNTGEANFTINFTCQSSGDACDWVELSDESVELNTLDRRSQTIEVTGVLPKDIPESGYRFNIRATDPSFQEGSPELGGVATARFKVQNAPIQSIPIRIITKLFSFREIDLDGDGGGDPIPYPFIALPVILALITFSIVSFIIGLTDDRFSGNGLKLGFAVLVFIISFGLL